MELIDANTMWRCETCFYQNEWGCTHGYCDHGENYRPAMSKLKVVDAEPVVHGRWEINCDGYYPYCSVCQNEPPGREMSKYCPCCGAKMDAKDDVFTQEELEFYKKVLRNKSVDTGISIYKYLKD